MPLLSRGFGRAYRIEHWLSAPRLFMVRYDFFPELLLQARQRRLSLLSATLINRWPLSGPRRVYWRYLLGLFESILASSEHDRSRFAQLGLPQQRLITLEWRLDRIVARLERASAKWQKWQAVALLFEHLKKRSGPLLIMGSAWPQDVSLLAHEQCQKALRQGEITLVVAPHQLNASAVDALVEALLRAVNRIPIYRVGPSMTIGQVEVLCQQWQQRPGIVILEVPGVLCEAYAHASHAYVGGGFGRSIHSVLEPWPSCLHLACGPKIHRSTEFEWIATTTPDRLRVVSTGQDCWSWLTSTSLPVTRLQSDLAMAQGLQHNNRQLFFEKFTTP